MICLRLKFEEKKIIHYTSRQNQMINSHSCVQTVCKNVREQLISTHDLIYSSL